MMIHSKNMARFIFKFFGQIFFLSGFISFIFAAPPGDISDLNAVVGSNAGEINLMWTASGSDGFTGTADGYVVVFSTDGQISDDADFSTATVISQSWVPQISGATENQLITGLNPNATYYFAIHVYQATNGTSTWSRAGGINSSNFSVTRANPPSGLTSPSQTASSIDLQWNANGNTTGTTYDVERSTNGTGNWVVISTKPILSTFTDSALNANVTYYYQIRANNFSSLSTAYTSVLKKSTLANSPASLVSSTQTNRSIDLQWSANNNSSQTTYDLEESLNGSSGWSVILNKSTNTTYSVSNLSELTTYFFRVRAYNNVQTATTYSSTLSTATLWIQPGSISSLAATSGTNDGEVNLTWVAPGNDGTSGTVVSYLVRYATFNVTASNFSNTNVSTFTQSWSSLQSAGQIETRVVNGLTPSSTYFFAIKAQDSVGAASWSDSSNPSRSSYAKDLVPPAPTWVSYSVDDHQVNISWSVPAIPDLDGFILDTSTDNFISFTSNIYASFVTSKFDPSLLNETTYYYRLRAFDTPPVVSTSAYSATISTATPDTEPPGQVTGFSATRGNVEGELKFTWVMPGDDYTAKNLVSGSAYRIKVSTNPSYSWNSLDYTLQASTIAVVGSTSSAIVSGLIAGTTYYSRIWVLDEKGNTSSLSAGATSWAQVDVSSPSQIGISSITAQWHRIELSWDAPGDDGGTGILNGRLEIAYSSLSNITNTAQFTSAPGQISIATSIAAGSRVGKILTGLVTGVTTYFSVRAFDERNNVSPISTSQFIFPPNSAPGAFNLTSPSDNAIVTTNQPIFDWTDSIDVDSVYGDTISYTVSYSTSSGFENNISTTATGLSSSQLTPLALQEDKTIYWRVSVTDTDGITLFGNSNPMRVRINTVNSSPSSFNLLSPTDQSLANPQNVTLDWQDSTDSDPGDVVSYLIEVSTSNSLLPLFLSSVTSVSTFALSNLVENATYYWRVKATDSQVNTVSSTFWFSINATPEAPQLFSLLSPTNDQRLQTLTPTLSWRDSLDPDPGGSTSFKLFYSTFSNFSSSATVSLSTTSYTLPTQPDNTNFYWFVQAIDNTGLTTNSNESWHFYTDLIKEAPLSFQLLTPTNTITISDLQPVFTWTASTDHDPFDTVRYFIELSVNDPTFSGVQGIPTSVDNFFVPTADLVDHTTYYWRVKAGGYQNIPPSLVDSTFTVSPTFSFRLDTINIFPQSFNLTSPLNSGAVDTQKPTLTWAESKDTSDDFVSYSVQISTSISFSPISASTTGLVDLSWSVPSKLSEQTTYYWRVIAKDKSNAETYSTQTNSFLVPVLTRLRHPNGFSGVFNSNLTQGVLSWFQVTENTDASIATDLVGYHIYRATSAETAGDSSPFATISSSTPTWTDTSLNGTQYFYMVRAYDDSGIESVDSSVIQAGVKTNNYIFSPKKDLIVTMDAETSAQAISSDGETYRVILNENADISGRTLKSFELKIEKESDDSVVKNFKFLHPIHLEFSLKGISSSALSSQVHTLSSAGGQSAVYWFNGVEFIKLGGDFDSSYGILSIQVIQSGEFQVREVSRASSFELGRVWPPKTFTPNNDGVNDVIHFIFENPKDTPVSGKIFNLQGAFIGNMSDGSDGSSLEWDGKDAGGQLVAKGVYLYQIESDGKTLNGTIVVAR